MTKEKGKSKRLVMTEPTFKKRKGLSAEMSGTAVKRSPLSKTAHKRKSLSGREILRQRKLLKQRQEDDLSRRLFPYVEEKEASSQDSPKHSSKKVSKVHKGLAGKKSKGSLVSSPELDVIKNAEETFDDSMNSTLPFEERNNENVENDNSETEDNIVSFLRTPGLNGKTDREEDMDKTPLLTKKTPMPEGDEQWLYSSKKKRNKARRLKGKYLLKCDNLPKGTTVHYLGLFLAECDLFPKIVVKQAVRAGRGRKRVSNHAAKGRWVRTEGISSHYVTSFDANGAANGASGAAAGAGGGVADIYAILYCNTEEDRDKLLQLDEITMPSVTNSKDRVLRIVPMLTKQDTRSIRALRISNLAEGVTEQDLRDFFERKEMSIYKVYLYPNDRCAIVLFRRANDAKKALLSEGSKLLKGSEMEFHPNVGQMMYGERGELLPMDDPSKKSD
ncbi:hypothetical protein HOLleu_39438 [Holothuria leucospilota]|uniref:RRM domain-containing protein n=1 Tax=Holothuria leucospilota TaxID=206669 RepID=A0A9Q1BBX7_HOLLE|nr:hypothetical protein HOLleu_39438 [Holothuria leucospilota]